VCICEVIVTGSGRVQWSTSATATESMLDKPPALSLGDRLRLEFGVDALDDPKSGQYKTLHRLCVLDWICVSVAEE